MRILFVAMAHSVHTARWLSQLRECGWDIHLFPDDESLLHPDLRDVTVYTLFRQRIGQIDPSVRQRSLCWPLRRGKGMVRRALAKFLPDAIKPAARLAKVIRRLRPDIVHSLEMQHAGYLTLESQRYLKCFPFPAWIYSSWGSDLFFFGRQSAHKARIRAVLNSCDYYIADCQRDVRLATEFGFKGEVLGVFPVVGGYHIGRMRPLRESGPVSGRRVILLKGYHGDNWAGRALVALEALRKCDRLLAGHELIIYSPDPDVVLAARDFSRATGLSTKVLPHSPHEEILKWMGHARLAIGLNVTDGTPNSMLEAMVMGAFPIQSDTISTGEWITSGENGLLVPPEDPDAVAAAIRRALTDDALVERAAEVNAKMTQERLDSSVIQPQVIALYEKVARQGKRVLQRSGEFLATRT